MNNQNQSSEGKTKNITFGLVFSWFYGIFVGIPASMMLFKGNVGTGLLLLATVLVIFPPTAKFLEQKLHVSFSRGLKIAIVLIALIITGAVSVKDGKVPSQSDMTGNNSVTEKAEAIPVTASALARAYIDNEVSADITYKDKLLQVTGTIKDIGKDILDTPYILLDGEPSDYFSNVQCMFAKADQGKLAVLKKGTRITLEGENSGKLGNVILRNCSIVES